MSEPTSGDEMNATASDPSTELDEYYPPDLGGQTSAGTTPAAHEQPDISDLIPISNDRPAEVVRFETVALTDIPGAPADGLAPLSGPLDLGSTELQGYSRPGEGVIVTAEQRWLPRGVTLGRLLHSLALRVVLGVSHPLVRDSYRFGPSDCVGVECEDGVFHRVASVVWSLGVGAGLCFR